MLLCSQGLGMLEAVVDTIIDADVARSNAMDPSAVAGALTDNARRGLVFEPPSSIALARSASVDDDGDDDATRGVFSLLSEDDMLAAVTAPQLPERIAVRCAPCRDAVARCAWWLTVLCWTLLVVSTLVLSQRRHARAGCRWPGCRRCSVISAGGHCCDAGAVVVIATQPQPLRCSVCSRASR
jgi:hypothetical protein